MHECFHRGVPETIETKKIHFLDGLLVGPFLHRHAIAGDEHAGAIVAEAAVHEDFFFWIVMKQRKKLRYLRVRWRSPATDRDVHKADAERFGLFALPRNSLSIFAAEIDNRCDSELLEFCKPRLSRLRSAIEKVIQFSRIGDSIDVQLLSKDRRGSGC